MPNWCDNKIVFICDEANISELKRLQNTLSMLYKTPLDTVRLESVAQVHGLDHITLSSCNGEIAALYEHEEDDLFFKLYTITAWKPTDALWAEILKQYTGIRYVYVAEQHGCNIFVNTDRTGAYFPEKYMLYAVLSDGLPDELPPKYFTDELTPEQLFDDRWLFDSFEEIQKFMFDITGKSFKSLETMNNYLRKAMSEYDPEETYIMEIHEYEPSLTEELLRRLPYYSSSTTL